MSQTHTVKDGEFLAGIAARFGFHTIEPIWDHPDNAALKDKRKNPSVLLAGDVLVIPDLEIKQVDAATGQAHAFEAKTGTVILNLKLEDTNAKALAERDCAIQIGDSGSGQVPPLPLTTDKNGKITQKIPSSATDGLVVVTKIEGEPADRTFRLVIGGLDPVATVGGMQARLNNLGYFAGFTKKDEPQLRWAIEEFQLDHGIKPNGDPTDAKTQQKLAQVHGDDG